MLKYFLYMIKNKPQLGLQTNTSKVDDMTFRGGALTQHGNFLSPQFFFLSLLLFWIY